MSAIQEIKNIEEVKKIYNLFFADYPDVVTLDELAEMLRISDKTAIKLLHDEKINSFKIGNEFKIPKYWVLVYMNLV